MLLVTATQQKYRSARVTEELAAAAHGARVVFVETHADTDDDIREDWRAVLQEKGDDAHSCEAFSGPIHIFRVDSLRALADAQGAIQPHGEFAELLDLLTRQMAGAAGNRIRRANFLELTTETLDACCARIDEALPRVEQLRTAIDEQRALLSQQIVGEMQAELLAHRRQWENRLLAQTASRWGFSPFALSSAHVPRNRRTVIRSAALSRPHAGADGPLGRDGRCADMAQASAEPANRRRPVDGRGLRHG